jgi:hypothetical protein
LAGAFQAARESRLGPLRNEGTFLLGERRVNVDHERVYVRAQFGDQERHTLRHQP